MLIDIDMIIVGTGRLRGIDEKQVEALVASITDVGLLNPLTVKPAKVLKGGGWVDGFGLVAGFHRLEAVKRLGWDEVEVHVVSLDDLHCQLAECDENLCGTKLSPSERAWFLLRRKEIYENIHPETKAGVAQGIGMKKAASQDLTANLAPRSDVTSFVADTAANTGQSERKVFRDVARAKAIDPAVLDEIKGTALDKGVVLDEVAKAPKEEQFEVVRKIAERNAAKEETVVVKPKPEPEVAKTVKAASAADKKAETAWRKELLSVWKSGKAAWRDRIYEELGS
jgi:nucleotide-binding universal stress UspA family protein